MIRDTSCGVSCPPSTPRSFRRYLGQVTDNYQCVTKICRQQIETSHSFQNSLQRKGKPNVKQHQEILDIIADHSLTQIVDKPTRNDKTLDQYRSESLRKLCVAYNNVFRFLCREPRNCSASHMFVSRGLPTCNMLIRKSIYAFMTSTKRSCNTILQNIVGSDHTLPHCASMHTSLFSFFYRITV